MKNKIINNIRFKAIKNNDDHITEKIDLIGNVVLELEKKGFKSDNSNDPKIANYTDLE